MFVVVTYSESYKYIAILNWASLGVDRWISQRLNLTKIVYNTLDVNLISRVFGFSWEKKHSSKQKYLHGHSRS